MRKGLLFSEWLLKEGYSSQLLKKYRDSGWLKPLGKGVMYPSNIVPTAYGALSSYNEQLSKTFRVAAHSALELAGFNHYVPIGKPLLMVAYPKAQRKPQWIESDIFDMTFKLFSTEIFTSIETTMVRVDNDISILASVPEQAFLECLSLATTQYSYMDLYYIMEQLTTLRPLVLQHLLEEIKSINVKRMFLYMAEKSGHAWYDDLDLSQITLGDSKIQMVKNGVYVSEYKITVPKELNEYD